MVPPKTPEKQERNLGVDLLRCAAMWMIACLHVLNRGGALSGVTGTVRISFTVLNILVNCGVNLYALISGFVTVRSRFHPARAAELWLQVVFFNLVIALVGECLRPHIMDGFWLRYLFPVTQKCFWYFTAYIGVYAFSPILNRGLLGLNRRQCRAMIWTMLLLFSVGSVLGYLNQGDPWAISTGYSVLWLLALYVIGACIRLSGFGKQTAGWKLLLIAAALTAATALCRLQISTGDANETLTKLRSASLYYVGPAAAGISVCLLLLFERLRISDFAAKLVKFAAPLTFGVYIIHVHHVVWVWIDGRFRALGKLPAALAVPAVVGCGLGIFAACALLDWCRSVLFRRLQVRNRLDRLESRFLGWLRAETTDQHKTRK